MAVTLVGTGGLFTRIGLLGGILNSLKTYRGTPLPGKVDTYSDQFNSDKEFVDSLYSYLSGGQEAFSGFLASLKAQAESYLIEMVNADNPQPDKGVETALIELIRQMEASSDDVNASTVSPGSLVPDSGNSGDGSIGISTYTARGRICENLLAEDIVITCIADAQEGEVTSGQESFSAVGEFSEGDALRWNWPDGSAASIGLTCIDATLDATDGNNLLTNGDMEDWTSNVPNSWALDVGVAGTDIARESTTKYAGTYGAKFIGGTATLTAIKQRFTTASTTTATNIDLAPLRQYCLNFVAKVDVVPASGVLTVALVNASGTVLTDDSGNACSFTTSLPSLTTSWRHVSGALRTPRVLPSEIWVRLKITTAIPAGTNLFLDHVSFAEMIEFYPQGPSLLAFSGATAFAREDWFLQPVTNTAGGFQRLFDRLFGMRDLGLLLPSDTGGTETISDALIT